MFVIIDNHSEDDSYLTDTATWTTTYAELVSKLVADPATQQRLIVDIINEPDDHNVEWPAVGSSNLQQGVVYRIVASESSVNLHFIAQNVLLLSPWSCFIGET